MTVFSTVTATLSADLAWCMKAKGKTWKEAFFDSLKALAGVEYTVYRKENQWQIRGEWESVKKAYNILTKVALIEKDAIAAYQAEVAEQARAAQLLSPGDNAGRKRRRGRPPKKRPFVEAVLEGQNQDTPLPPKRKRGRPRKVKIEEVKNESDIDEIDEEYNVHCEANVATGVLRDASSEAPSEKLYCPSHEPISPAEQTVSVRCETASSPENMPNKRSQYLGRVEGKELRGISENMVDEQFYAHESSYISQDASKAQSMKGEGVKGALSAGTKCTREWASQKEKNSSSIKESLPDAESKNAGQNLPSQFSDVVIVVAKEAIAGATIGIQNPVMEDKATVMAKPETTQSEENVSKGMENTEETLTAGTKDDPQSSRILDYLGIKHRNVLDDMPEETDRFSGDQSKKLEELIEIMLEKMDKTIKETKTPAPVVPKYICTECPYTSHKKAFLRGHMKKTHMRDDDPDEAEGQPPSAVAPQKKFLGPRKLYKCFECNYSSNSRKHLKEHRMRRHREKGLECTQCHKKFAVERDLTRHQKDHESGDTRHNCTVCGKAYKQQYVLKRHMETHADGYIKPMFPCTVCSKTFAAKQVLQIHMNSVHLGKRPSYPCPTCNKTFTTKHSLSEHQLIHSNAKPYMCNICKKAFRHESTLKTHQRLHMDTSQRFTCEYCGKAFRLRSSLRIHRNIHTGDKRFECPVCKKVFTQKQSLLRHARIHTGEKPFQCEICGSAFYDYSILRRHVTGVHKMQWKSPTQHYVLPPGSYQDGKVIEEKPPQKALGTTSTQDPAMLSSKVTLTSQQGPLMTVTSPAPRQAEDSMHTVAMASHGHHRQQPHQQQPPQPHPPSSQQSATGSQQQQQQQHQQQAAQVYQSSAPSVTPQSLPSTSPASHADVLQVHSLSARHLLMGDRHDHPGHDLKSLPSTTQQQVTYHSSIISPNVYQPPHIPLPSTLPSSLPLSQTQPLQSQSAGQPQQNPQHPGQSLHSPSPTQHLSPMSPLSVTQYQQSQSHPAHQTHPPLTLPSPYTLTQQIFYQNPQ